MPELVRPTSSLHAAWLVAHREWGPGPHEDGFGLAATDDVSSGPGFAAWVERLRAAEHRCVSRWIVESGQVMGGIALRLGEDDFIRQHGHIGYGIRPGARGRQLATWALHRMLDEARRHGMDRVLVVCELDNVASSITVERAGGQLDEAFGAGSARRYWINVDTAPQP